MLPVVYKFGGTSLGTAENIRKAYSIVCKNKPQFIVVSAVAGVTDLLDAFCSVAEQFRRHIFYSIERKHQQIIEELGITFSLDVWMDKIRVWVDGGGISPQDRAEILAFGEDISASLFHSFCCQNHFAMCFLEARSVVLTNDVYDCATPDIVKMHQRWKEIECREETCYLMQGFIGSNGFGHTTLLGRGGSDYSGALLAEVSGSKEVHIYTDIDGVYTMDPKIVREAQLISRLSFEEMQYLSDGGARVIYPPMLSSCIRANIPIFITSTFKPCSCGTWVEAKKEERAYIKAIAMRKKQCLWLIRSDHLSKKRREILSALESLCISSRCISFQETQLYFVTGLDTIPKHVLPLISEKLSAFGEVHVLQGVALITLVGGSEGISQLLQERLCHLSPIFYTHTALSFTVVEEAAEEIVQKLHHEYILSNLACV